MLPSCHEEWILDELSEGSMSTIRELVGQHGKLRVVLMGGDGTYNWFVCHFFTELEESIQSLVQIAFFPLGKLYSSERVC